MKYIVQLRLHPGVKNAAFEYFERRGPNQNPGVELRGAWIGKEADLVFALVEGDDPQQIQAAGASWKQFGQFEVYPVTDIEQY